jgi:hypothetical protein
MVDVASGRTRKPPRPALTPAASIRKVPIERDKVARLYVQQAKFENGQTICDFKERGGMSMMSR